MKRSVWQWFEAMANVLVEAPTLAAIECDRRILMAELAERNEEVKLLSDRVDQLGDACAELSRELVKARNETEIIRRFHQAATWRQA